MCILCHSAAGLLAATPEISIEQSALDVPDGGSVDFGSVALGANSLTREFTIFNTGDGDLVGLAITKDGDDPEDFIISTPADSVAGGGSTTFTVTFTPDAAGLRSCVLHVANNDADENPFDITFSGTGASNVPLEIAQTAYLKSSTPFSQDYFGYSVAASGDMVVVGVPFASAIDSGAVHVFTRNAGVWTEEAVLTAGNPGFDDYFGYSVGISGDTLVVGAPLEDSSVGGVNGIPNEGAGNSGAAYVFVRVNGTWSQQAYLKAGNPGAGDQFGWSVAVSGDTVVVGANHEDSNVPGVDGIPNELAVDSGAAYVFSRSGAVWAQQAFLKAGNPGAADEFGAAVAVSADTVVIGSAREDSSTMGVNSVPDEMAANSGAAYVFTRTEVTWTQQAYLKAGNAESEDEFGKSVAVSGDRVVVGAPWESGDTPGVNGSPNENGTGVGAAYAFTRDGVTWIQDAYLKAANPGSYDFFGDSVSISGDAMVVGATGESGSSNVVNGIPDDGALYSGAAYLFEQDGGGWTQLAYLKAGNPGVGDYLGLSVAISGDTVVAGAPSESSSSSGVSSIPDDNSLWAGAAYIFSFARDPDIALKNPDGFGMTRGISEYDLGYGTAGSNSLVYPNLFLLRNYGTSDLSLGEIQVTGADAADFVVGLANTADLAPGESREILVWLRPVASGARSAMLSIPSNDPDENPFTITLSGTGGTSAEAWRYHYFKTIDNIGNAAEDADPDEDGLVNLLERAFNLHPGQPARPVLVSDTGTAGLPLIRRIDGPGGSMLSIQYLRRKSTAYPGLIYTPQFSSDLVTPWLDAGIVETLESIDGEWERVTVEENTTGVPIRFGRVKIEAP